MRPPTQQPLAPRQTHLFPNQSSPRARASSGWAAGGARVSRGCEKPPSAGPARDPGCQGRPAGHRTGGSCSGARRRWVVGAGAGDGGPGAAGAGAASQLSVGRALRFLKAGGGCWADGANAGLSCDLPFGGDTATVCLVECPALVSMRDKYHQLFCVHNSMRQFIWQNNMLLLVRYGIECLDSFAATQ